MRSGAGSRRARKSGLGLHPLAVRLEAGAAELVEDQAGVVLAVFEQEDAERSGHRRLHLVG